MMDSLLKVTLLLLLGQLTILISCQSSQEAPMLNAEVYPDVSREGDSVTLLCRVSNFNVNNHVVALIKVTPSLNVIVSSETVQLHENRFDVSFEQIDDSNQFVLNVTIEETLQTDNGTYVCNLNEESAPGSVSLKKETFVVSVYPISAFPNCQPRGGSQVDISSRLVCMSDLTPSIFQDCGKWNFAGTLLTKNVTSADNGKTFICMVNVTSYQSLSCNIGPLYITSGLPVLTSTESTTDSSAIPNSGLSAADISGIVIGVIVLIILVAVHILCCQCNPRRCWHAKTYLFDIGSSSGTSNRRQSDVEPGGSLRAEQDDEPPPHEQLGISREDSSQPVAIVQPHIYAEPVTKQQLLETSLAVRPNSNNTAPRYSENRDTGSRREHIPTEGDGEVCPISDVHQPTSSMRGNDPPTEATEMSRVSSPAQIYTKVNNQKGTKTDTSLSLTDKASGAAKMKVRNIKTFGKNGQGSEEDDRVQGAIVYADLDMNGTEQDNIKEPIEPPTIYAQIKK